MPLRAADLFRCVIVLFPGLICPDFGIAQTGSFQGIGTLGGLNPSSAGLSVSPAGPVVVGSAKPGPRSGFSFPIRWTGGTIEQIVGLPGDGAGIANAVSADGGAIVGTTGIGSGVNSHAFRSSPSGILILSSFLGDDGGSQAFAVSSDGAVVVGAAASLSGSQAFRWNNAGGLQGLGDLPGGAFSSVASAVSADGNVVVGSSESAHGYEAFRWTQADGMVSLWSVTGVGNYNGAEGVSADGAVAVGYFRPESGNYQAFRWTQATGMTPLGDLSGGQGSTAHGVSEDGSIVVGESYYNSNGGAFIWNAEHGMRNLQDLLTLDLGLDLTGWRLGAANGIATTADTVYVVGTGLNPQSQPEGFLATIPKSALMPEPGCLAGLGLFSILFGRRRSNRVI